MIEFLVVFGVLVLIAVVPSAVLIAEHRVQRAVHAQRDAVTDATLAVDAITLHLTAATSILPSATIGGQTITTGPLAIAFDVPTVTATGDLTGTRDVLAVARDDANPALLVLHVAPGAGSRVPAGTRTIARRVTAVTYRYDAVDAAAARRVGIAVTSTATLREQIYVASTTGMVTLHNAP